MAFVYFAEALVLARELRRRKIGRLHNHFANAGAIVGYLAAGLLRIPWSFTMHGISETDYPAGLLLAKKIQAAEFVACVSYFGRAQAMRLVAPDQWPKLHVVRCGLALDRLPRHARCGDRQAHRLRRPPFARKGPGRDSSRHLPACPKDFDRGWTDLRWRWAGAGTARAAAAALGIAQR